MKGKTLLSLAIVLAMILSAMPFIAVKAVTPTVVSVVLLPSGTQHQTETPGTNFVANITISTAAYVGEFDMHIGWNVSMLELGNAGFVNDSTHDVTGSPWLTYWAGVWGSSVLAPGNILNAPAGTLEVPMGLTGGNATGSGTMFAVDFRAVHPGSEDAFINILGANTAGGSHLLNGTLTGGITIDATVNATVHIPIPPSTSPTAKITLPLGPGPYTVGGLVEYSGSTSLPGFASVPSPGQTAPINWTISYWKITNS